MPENRTHPVNRSPKEDSSQINEHLNTMPIDKLTDALADMWMLQTISHIQHLRWMRA